MRFFIPFPPIIILKESSFWHTIQNLAGHNTTAPGGAPETVNHNKPPSYHIKQVYEIGRCRDSYIKPRDAKRILNENDPSVAIGQCPELKLFIDTILEVSGGAKVSWHQAHSVTAGTLSPVAPLVTLQVPFNAAPSSMMSFPVSTLPVRTAVAVI